MNKPLVSIITPCYNSEKTIARLMDSVLLQTYDNIEFILINDGSTDSSELIVKEYQPKFIQRGYKFIYYYQENKGLGGAINSGLKLFKGDYLCWPDADDYLEPESIEERVNVLQQNLQYAVVTSNAYVRKENNICNARLLVSSVDNDTLNENQFEFMLNGDSIFCSGCHMVRSSAFLEVNPKREIYPARRGQNWQMLLPLYYKYKRYFLNKPLYNYIIYSNSMSRADKTVNDFIIRYDEHKEILIKVLETIEKVQKVNLEFYKNQVKLKYCVQKLTLAIKMCDNSLFDEQYKIKKELGLTNQDRFYFLIRHIKLLQIIYNKLRG